MNIQKIIAEIKRREGFSRPHYQRVDRIFLQDDIAGQRKRPHVGCIEQAVLPEIDRLEVGVAADIERSHRRLNDPQFIEESVLRKIDRCRAGENLVV